MVFLRRVVFLMLLMALFASGFITANYLPSPRLYAGQTFTIPPSEDSQAATGTVEFVAVQDHLHMKRIIFRANTPNDTDRRAIEVVMERQGYKYWDNMRYITEILEVDGWVYMWGIFVLN